MSTDGSVLYNAPLQKVRAMKVCPYICEKYVNVKFKIDWLDQIIQSLLSSSIKLLMEEENASHERRERSCSCKEGWRDRW